MEELYANAAKHVHRILCKQYGMASSQAEQAIANSPMKLIFEDDSQMAAHTSNEDWARDVYEYWKKSIRIE